MERNIPSVTKVPIEKKLNNSMEVFYGKLNDRTVKNSDNYDVAKKINKIFASSDYVYKKNVVITTSNGELHTTIIGKTGGYLLTSNNDKILITDIIDIY